MDNLTLANETEVAAFANGTEVATFANETEVAASNVTLPPALSTLKIGLVIIPYSIMAFASTFGNGLVIWSVLTRRYLRTPPNILIMSLAFTDLSVGLFVLPFNLTELILHHWIFGWFTCLSYLTIAVTMYTASVLHLTCIAVDRFRTIREGLSYVQNRTVRGAVHICICIWIVAFYLSSTPAFGWNEWDYTVPFPETKRCFLPRKLGYVLFTTLGQFFLPATLLVIVYTRIFYLIRERLAKRANYPGISSKSNECSIDGVEDGVSNISASSSNPQRNTRVKFTSLSKERRAVKTLGVIIGAFLICLGPFAIVYVINAFCMHYKTCNVPRGIMDTSIWLVSFNSSLNPVIYTVCNPEFRRAFKSILRIERN